MANRYDIINAPCDRCGGQPHLTYDGKPACGGHSKPARGSKPCGARAGWGTDHVGYGFCKAHGGSTRTGEVNAAKLQAAAAVATYGLPVDTTPEQALLDEVHRTAGHVAWLRGKLAELEPEALVWGTTKTERIGANEFTGTNTTDAAVVNVWLDLYLRERRHLVDVCKTAINAGIAERHVRLVERQGELLGDLLRAAMDAADMSEEQEERAYDAVRLRLVDAAAG